MAPKGRKTILLLHFFFFKTTDLLFLKKERRNIFKKKGGYFPPFRSSPSQMFFKIGVLKNFTSFTGKHLREEVKNSADSTTGED